MRAAITLFAVTRGACSCAPFASQRLRGENPFVILAHFAVTFRISCQCSLAEVRNLKEEGLDIWLAAGLP